jgi:hypothetical protein
LRSSTYFRGCSGEALMALICFTRAILRMLSGLMIWAAYFLVIYVFTALACARRFADLSWLGIGVVPWVIGTATLAAATTTLVVIGLAVHDARLKTSRNNMSSFVPWMTAAFGGLALVAILWEALPVLLVPTCG